MNTKYLSIYVSVLQCLSTMIYSFNVQIFHVPAIYKQDYFFGLSENKSMKTSGE